VTTQQAQYLSLSRAFLSGNTPRVHRAVLFHEVEEVVVELGPLVAEGAHGGARRLYRGRQRVPLQEGAPLGLLGFGSSGALELVLGRQAGPEGVERGLAEDEDPPAVAHHGNLMAGKTRSIGQLAIFMYESSNAVDETGMHFFDHELQIRMSLPSDIVNIYESFPCVESWLSGLTFCHLADRRETEP